LGSLPEVFGSKKRMAFFAVIVALVGGVTIWHSLGSTTMKSVAERPWPCENGRAAAFVPWLASLGLGCAIFGAK